MAFAAVFVLSILFVFVTALYPLIKGVEKVDRFKEHFSTVEAYPFAKSGSSSSSSTSSDSKTSGGRLARITAKFDEISKEVTDQEDTIQGYVTDDYPYNSDFVLIEKRFEKLAGFNATTSSMRMENDLNLGTDVSVELSDGVFGYITDDFKDVKKKTKKVVDFANYLKKKDINFLFFETPGKTDDDAISEKYMGAYHDYSREKLNDILTILEKNKVDYVSYTQHVDKMGWDKQSLFFKTDHHWLPQTALDACSVLTEELNERYGYEVDTSIYDLDNYEINYSDPICLGASGRQVTEVYADKERMPLVIPKYDSNIEVFKSRSNKTKTGTIEETLLDYSELDPAEFDNNIYNMNMFRFYASGNMQLVSIHNLQRSDGHRILLVKTSFANAMLPYICNSAEYVDAIDLRCFKGSLKTLIKETQPDTVVVAYGTIFYETSNARVFRFE